MARIVLYIFLFLFAFQSTFTYGQAESGNSPIIGQLCPDFKFDSVFHFDPDRKTLRQLSGKWLLLDFFSVGCVACFESFPKMEHLREKFSGKINFILVGLNKNQIRSVYEKYAQHLRLHLPIAYDTVLFRQFQIESVPYILIVDPKGFVNAITTAESITDSLLTDLLVRKHPYFELNENARKWIPYDYRNPLLISGNGGADTDFLFRSLLARWDPRTKQIILDFGRRSNWKIALPNGIQVTGASLHMLYSIAYFGVATIRPTDTLLYGKYYPFEQLRIKNAGPFKENFQTGENVWNYSLIVPKKRVCDSILMRIMKCDLKNYFGYSVKLEDRSMPCYILKASPQARIKTMSRSNLRGRMPTDLGQAINGWKLENCRLINLISLIRMFHQDEPPIVDETGIKGLITLDVRATMTDLGDIQRELLKYGLSLRKGYRKMKAMVIRD